jgi:hypothetical protein
MTPASPSIDVIPLAAAFCNQPQLFYGYPLAYPRYPFTPSQQSNKNDAAEAERSVHDENEAKARSCAHEQQLQRLARSQQQ